MDSYATERTLVLIVEDEFLIRTCAAEVIRDAGFEVIEASNADEAIKFLRTVSTFEWSLQTSKCRDRWMGSNSRGPSVIAGPQSS